MNDWKQPQFQRKKVPHTNGWQGQLINASFRTRTFGREIQLIALLTKSLDLSYFVRRNDGMEANLVGLENLQGLIRRQLFDITKSSEMMTKDT